MDLHLVQVLLLGLEEFGQSCHNFFILSTWKKNTPCWRGGRRLLVATALLEKCEDDTHTPEMGTLESTGTPKTSELDCRGQNTSHWGVFYIIGKLWKCRCWKWACMVHLDICSSSYVQKKGRESNWQFDSRPLKVKNQPDPGVCRGSATHCWKALKESYKFALNLVPIRGLSKELWPCEVPGVQTGTISGQFRDNFMTPRWESRDKSHSDVGAAEYHREYYMGEGGGFPRVWAVVSQMSPCCPWLVPTPKVVSNVY
jgi:hypothetical protein